MKRHWTIRSHLAPTVATHEWYCRDWIQTVNLWIFIITTELQMGTCMSTSCYTYERIGGNLLQSIRESWNILANTRWSYWTCSANSEIITYYTTGPGHWSWRNAIFRKLHRPRLGRPPPFTFQNAYTQSLRNAEASLHTPVMELCSFRELVQVFLGFQSFAGAAFLVYFKFPKCQLQTFGGLADENIAT